MNTTLLRAETGKIAAILFRCARVAGSTAFNKPLPKWQGLRTFLRLLSQFYPAGVRLAFRRSHPGELVRQLLRETLESLQALPDQQAAAQIRQQLDEIARRRAAEEGE